MPNNMFALMSSLLCKYIQVYRSISEYVFCVCEFIFGFALTNQTMNWTRMTMICLYFHNDEDDDADDENDVENYGV